MELSVLYGFWIFSWIIFGGLGYFMAEKRKRSPGAGFLLGFLLGIIGLLIIALMGDKNE